MPNYEPYHIIVERHTHEPAFIAWMEQLKKEFHEVYPTAYLSLDEKYLIQSYNSGMTPHMTLSEKHYD